MERGAQGQNKATTQSGLGAYVPPQNIEAEQSVIAAMLLDESAVEIATEILKKEDFYRDHYQQLFGVLVDMHAASKPIDLVTVREELLRLDLLDSLGGMPHLTALFDTLPTAANIAYYAKLVHDKAILRRILLTSFEAIGLARGDNDDVTKILDDVQSRFYALSEISTDSRDLIGIDASLDKIMQDAKDASEARRLGQSYETGGLLTNIDAFNLATDGLQCSDLIIVAGRPGMGKTALAGNWAQHAVMEFGKPTAIFSLEMSTKQLAMRMICSHAEVRSHDLRQGMASAADWERAQKFWRMIKSDRPILRICDDIGITVSGMRSRLRKMKRDVGLGLVIVDYLQLVKPERHQENRNLEVMEITMGLKGLAREFNVPVVALSQLSRGVESRANKRPMLSDLRDSGSIEAEADLIVFPYNEAYYQRKRTIETFVVNNPATVTIEEVELIIAKARNGSTGIVKCGFIPGYAKFVNERL